MLERGEGLGVVLSRELVVGARMVPDMGEEAKEKAEETSK